MKTYEKVTATILSALLLFMSIWMGREVVLIHQARRSSDMTEVAISTSDTVSRHGISGHKAELMVWSTLNGRTGLHADTNVSSKYEAYSLAQRMADPKELQLDSSSTSIKINGSDTAYTVLTVYKVIDK